MARHGKQRIPQNSKRSRQYEKDASFAGIPSKRNFIPRHPPKHLRKSKRWLGRGLYSYIRRLRRVEHELQNKV